MFCFKNLEQNVNHNEKVVSQVGKCYDFGFTNLEQTLFKKLRRKLL